MMEIIAIVTVIDFICHIRMKSVPKTKGTNNFNVRSTTNCFFERFLSEYLALMPANINKSGINHDHIALKKELKILSEPKII